MLTLCGSAANDMLPLDIQKEQLVLLWRTVWTAHLKGSKKTSYLDSRSLADSPPLFTWPLLCCKGCDGVARENCVFLLPVHWLEIFDNRHRCHLKVRRK